MEYVVATLVVVAFLAFIAYKVKENKDSKPKSGALSGGPKKNSNDNHK